MFITVERANKITGNKFNLTLDDVFVAQTILETYTGREESVITDADDLELYAKATAFQAAYMKNDDNNVFEQAQVQTISQDSSTIDFRPGDYASPFIAPLAVMALRQVTWKKSRSINTGRISNNVNRFFDWKRD